MALNLGNQQPNLTHDPSIFEQAHHRLAFLRRHPTFPQDPEFLAQMLTLALIIDEAQRIDDRNIDSFLAFLGLKYLPYLIKERDCNPSSPRTLWLHMGACDRVPATFRLSGEYRRMLDAHNNSRDDLKFKAFFAKNCQSLVELCQKPVSHEVYSAPITNLELELVIIDRALETKSKTHVPASEVGSKMTDDSKEEMLLELLGSMKSLVDVMSNGDAALASNSLEQSNKKRKRGTE